jgi:hypothetical protein
MRKERKLVAAFFESIPVYPVNEFDLKHVKMISFLSCPDGPVEPPGERDAL